MLIQLIKSKNEKAANSINPFLDLIEDNWVQEHSLRFKKVTFTMLHSGSNHGSNCIITILFGAIDA